jgi:hypothetical protein
VWSAYQHDVPWVRSAMSATARGFCALLHTHRLNQKYGYRSSWALTSELRFRAGILIEGGYSSEWDKLCK